MENVIFVQTTKSVWHIKSLLMDML